MTYEEELISRGYVKQANGVFVYQDELMTSYMPAQPSGQEIFYIPGGEGSDGDAATFKNQMLTGNPTYGLTVFRSSHYSGAEIAKRITETHNAVGAPIESTCVQTFSMGGQQSMQTAAAISNLNPNASHALLLGDSSYFERQGWDSYNTALAQVRDNGVKVILSDGVNYGWLSNPNEKYKNYSYKTLLFDNGIEPLFIRTGTNDHQGVNQRLITGNVAAYIVGAVDGINGNYETFKLSLNENPYSYTTTPISLEELRLEDPTVQYGTLYGVALSGKDTADLLSNSASPLVTDVAKAIDHVNKIGANAQTTTYAEQPTTQSTASIPSTLSQGQDSFLGVSTELSSNIGRECGVIANLAQMVYDMDKDLSSIAGGLSDGKNIYNNPEFMSQLNAVVNSNVLENVSFTSFVFPLSNQEGKVGKLNAAELKGMVSGNSLTGPLHENFESERQNAKQQKTDLNNFINDLSSSTFQGEIWDAVREKLGTYVDLMELREQYANKLEETYVKALKLITDYMDPYEELDDSRLPELKKLIDEIKEEIAESENIISATHVVSDPPSISNLWMGGSHTEYVYSESARQAARDYIVWAKDQLEIINKEIAKLEGLPNIINQAEDMINEALVEMYAKYAKPVSNVVVGKVSEYEPPARPEYVAITKETEVTDENVTAKEKQGFFGWIKDIYNKQVEYNAHNEAEATKNNHKGETLDELSEVAARGQERMKNALEHPEDDYLAKPYNPGPTEDEITAALDEAEREKAREQAESTTAPETETPTTAAPATTTAPATYSPAGQGNPSPSNPSPSNPSPSNPSPSDSGPSDSGPSDTTAPVETPVEETNAPIETTPVEETNPDTEPSSEQTTGVDIEDEGVTKPSTPVEDTNPTTEPTTVSPTTTPGTQGPQKVQPKPSTTPNRTVSTSPVKPTKVTTPKVEVTTPKVEVTTTPLVENVEQTIVPDTPEVNEPPVENVIENIPTEVIPNTNDIIEDVHDIGQSTVSSSSNSGAKTIGMIAAGAAAVGAAALGAHTYMKVKENNSIGSNDENSDYDDDEY